MNSFNLTLRKLIDVLPEMDKTLRHDFEKMAWEMVAHKLALFPDDKRVIINSKVIDEGGKFRVGVAALHEN